MYYGFRCLRAPPCLTWELWESVRLIKSDGIMDAWCVAAVCEMGGSGLGGLRDPLWASASHLFRIEIENVMGQDGV